MESRPLKVLGLGLSVAGAAASAWVLDHVTSRWPLAQDEALTLVVALMLAANALAAGVLVLVAGCGGARSLRHAGRRRALGLQVVVANLLVPAALLGSLFDGGEIEAGLADSGADLLVMAAVLAVTWAAWRLWRRSRRHEAFGAAEAMARDPRPPVLYLRSFVDDGRAFVEHDAPRWQRLGYELAGVGSGEELMTGILRTLGPVVAIGKPGEALPELGAARLYVSHDDWQQRVLELMAAATLVVVRVGATPGVRWEVEQALSRLPRHRLVFAIFEAQIAPELGAHLTGLLGPDLRSLLPQPPPSGMSALSAWLTSGLKTRQLGTLVCFDERARAHAIAVARPPPWRLRSWSGLRPYRGPLDAAWRRVFAHAGLTEALAPVERSRAVAVLLALGLGAFGAHWFYLGQRRRAWSYVATLPLLLAPFFLAWYDAWRFVWMDRAQFEARFVAPPRP